MHRRLEKINKKTKKYNNFVTSVYHCVPISIRASSFVPNKMI